MRFSHLVPAVLVAASLACGDRDARTDDTASTDTAAAPSPAPVDEAALAGMLPEGVTVQMVQDGRQIFHGQGICFTCHGQNGVSTQLGPALNDQQWIHLAQGSYDEIIGIVRTGVPQPRQYAGMMPPMGGAQLDDAQLRAVAAYVFALSRGALGAP